MKITNTDKGPRGVNTTDGLVMVDPGATVASGTGRLFGAALFGVAAVDAVSGTASSFKWSSRLC